MQISSSHLSASSLHFQLFLFFPPLFLNQPTELLQVRVCVHTHVRVCVSVRLVSQRAELQYRQFSTVERAHQTCAAAPSLKGLIIWGSSHLLGASEPPLLPLNELQRWWCRWSGGGGGVGRAD